MALVKLGLRNRREFILTFLSRWWWNKMLWLSTWSRRRPWRLQREKRIKGLYHRLCFGVRVKLSCYEQTNELWYGFFFGVNVKIKTKRKQWSMTARACMELVVRVLLFLHFTSVQHHIGSFAPYEDVWGCSSTSCMYMRTETNKCIEKLQLAVNVTDRIFPDTIILFARIVCLHSAASCQTQTTMTSLPVCSCLLSIFPKTGCVCLFLWGAQLGTQLGTLAFVWHHQSWTQTWDEHHISLSFHVVYHLKIVKCFIFGGIIFVSLSWFSPVC